MTRPATKYEIIHRTTYDYSEPVTISHHVARVEPRLLPTQTCESFALEIEPEPAIRKSRTDYLGNRLCSFSIQEVHQHLDIVASSRVAVSAGAALPAADSPEWKRVAALFRDPVSPDVVDPYQFVCDSPLVRASNELADYARQSFAADTPLLLAVADLNRRIHEDFRYDPVATSVATPLEEVIDNRRGVCQDFAHLAIASLRSLAVPARYVSGYLRTRPPEGKPRLVGADASHAWFSVFCPGVGWLDFDPTNNVQPSTEHIVLAYGRDFGDVSPVSGVLTGGGEHRVKVAVDVVVVEPASAAGPTTGANRR